MRDFDVYFFQFERLQERLELVGRGGNIIVTLIEILEEDYDSEMREEIDRLEAIENPYADEFVKGWEDCDPNNCLPLEKLALGMEDFWNALDRLPASESLAQFKRIMKELSWELVCTLATTFGPR